MCGKYRQCRRRIEEQDFVDGTGSLQTTDIIAEYIRRVSEDIPVTLGGATSIQIVIDFSKFNCLRV